MTYFNHHNWNLLENEANTVLGVKQGSLLKQMEVINSKLSQSQPVY